MNTKVEVFKQKFSTDPKFRGSVLIAGSGILMLAVVFFVWNSFTFVETDDAFIEADTVPISPKVPAHILKILVKDNQEVKAGDLLLELDERDYESRLDMAKAELRAAEAESEQAQQDQVRYEMLRKGNDVSKQQLEKAILRAQTAVANIALCKAKVHQAELDVSYTKIFAPCAGNVAKRIAVQGAYVLTGQPLMGIVTKEKWVVANFKETQLTHMRSGQEAEIKIDTYPGKKVRGHVDSIQRGTGATFSMFPPENAAGNFVKVVQRIPVKIVFDEEPDGKYSLAVGMSVVPEVKVR